MIRVGGTRVTLDTIIGAFKDGEAAEEIHEAYPTVSLADVYAVIAYYLRHQEEVEEYIKEQRREAEEVRRQDEARYDRQGIRERLLARRSSGTTTSE
ncbi:MAG: DUF433 domain-containing protein [Thermoanaerobaculia bacterium]